MASDKIKAHIKSKMNGWDGKPAAPARPEPDGPRPVNAGALDAWLRDCYEFQRRVRRDNLVLEKLLVDKGLIDKADLYGDPGDPPPPPDI